MIIEGGGGGLKNMIFGGFLHPWFIVVMTSLLKKNEMFFIPKFAIIILCMLPDLTEERNQEKNRKYIKVCISVHGGISTYVL